MNCNCSPFGNFRTRTFTEIFTEQGETSFETFSKIFVNSGIPLKLKQSSLQTLFYLLYARYGNSHIASFDENTFKYKLQSIIFMYGPTWERRVEIQDTLRALDEETILKGSEAIYNSAQAPGTELAGLVDETGKVDYISSQNTTAYRKSKMEGYTILLELLRTDVTKEFIDKFQSLFLKILEPYSPLWYETNVEGEN